MEDKILLKCSWCGSYNVRRITIDDVQCEDCKHKIDLYEAIKQAEKK